MHDKRSYGNCKPDIPEVSTAPYQTQTQHEDDFHSTHGCYVEMHSWFSASNSLGCPFISTFSTALRMAHFPDASALSDDLRRTNRSSWAAAAPQLELLQQQTGHPEAETGLLHRCWCLDTTEELWHWEEAQGHAQCRCQGNRRRKVEQVNQLYCSLDYTDIWSEELDTDR